MLFRFAWMCGCPRLEDGSIWSLEMNRFNHLLPSVLEEVWKDTVIWCFVLVVSSVSFIVAVHYGRYLS
jgi:hypothetical protein